MRNVILWALALAVVSVGSFKTMHGIAVLRTVPACVECALAGTLLLCFAAAVASFLLINSGAFLASMCALCAITIIETKIAGHWSYPTAVAVIAFFCACCSVEMAWFDRALRRWEVAPIALAEVVAIVAAIGARL